MPNLYPEDDYSELVGLIYLTPPYDWQHPPLVDWQDTLLEYGQNETEIGQAVGRAALQGGFVGHLRRTADIPRVSLLNQERAYKDFDAVSLTCPDQNDKFE